MSQNDRIVLDRHIDKRKKQVAPNLSEAEYFEIFTAEQILKKFDPSYEDVEDGIVGGGQDGGIDSLYLFVNGTLIKADTDLSMFKKNTVIELIFIQSKTSQGFQEETMNKFLASTTDLLNLSKPLNSLSATYNGDVCEKIGLFRKTQAEIEDFPQLRFCYFYVTRGTKPTNNLRLKVEPLKAKVKELFSSSEVEVSFVGVSELLEIVRSNPETPYKMVLSNNPISASNPISVAEGDSGSFVAIVNLSDYFDFITNDTNELQRNLFEANVRDYQGTVQVNKGIQDALQEREKAQEDFWWLNNGITIVASNATLSGNVLKIENPLIVNGLQTSTEIFDYFDKQRPKEEDRNLLVRVIVPSNEDSRNKIIKATNSQTLIPPVSLRATEQIHLNIEDYLNSYDIYYDRRKNFYKNQGKPREKIISIQKLAQSVMSIILEQPHYARARPSTLINNDADYDRIFTERYPIDVYRICAVILQKVEEVVKSKAANLQRKYRNNLKFYLAMVVAMETCKCVHLHAGVVKKIKTHNLDQKFILACLTDLKQIFDAQSGEEDQVAKSETFTNDIIQHMQTKFST